MINLETLKNDFSNYYLLDTDYKKDAAYYSLIIGLTEYFDTYHPNTLNNHGDAKNKTEINNKYENGSDYTKNVINIFIHLQHFLELQVKKELESINLLMSSRIKDPIILEKVLNNKSLSDEEIAKCYSVEMSDAVNRLCRLVKNGLLTTPSSKVLSDNRSTIEFVTDMRNRIMHRGKYIMKYCELDQVMSQHVLVLFKELLSLPNYSKYNKLLNGQIITALIEPIIQSGAKSSVDYSEIALYKAFAKARASDKYKEHLSFYKADKQAKWTEQVQKNYSSENFGVVQYIKCPCCKNDTLAVIFDIVDGEEICDEIGDEQVGVTIIHGWIPIYGQTLVSCANCGFTLSKFIAELEQYDKKYASYKIWQ